MPGPFGHKGKLMSFVSKTYAAVALLASCSIFMPASAAAQSPGLKSPKDVHGFYTQVPANQFSNSTGNFTFIVWKGDSSEVDPSWGGYRVRRTIQGISARPFELIGQWKARVIQAPLCWGSVGPCPGYPFQFQALGGGIFFHGFHENKRTDGTYVIDYPPGAPQDTCGNCWVLADGGSLAGFRHMYAVTAIDTNIIVDSDFYETPIDSSQIVSILPGSPAASDLERVAVVPNPYRVRAEWEPGDGSRLLRFIRVPDRATIRIFTSAGELLRTLTANQNQNPGGTTGDVSWDLRNDSGRGVVSGIYIYQIETVDGRSTKGKFVIIK